MPESAQERVKAHPRQKINQKDRKYYEKLYKSTVYFGFTGLEYQDGESGALAIALKKLRNLRLKSKSGNELSTLYRTYKENGLDQENPVVRRVFVGQLLQKLKIDQNAPGLISFMKLMIKETKSLQPILVNYLADLIRTLQAMPPSKRRDAKIKQLIKWLGVSEEAGGPFRPVDPFFGSKEDEREGGDEVDYGPLEGQKIIGSTFRTIDLSKYDPFQIILLKKMISGYNQFLKEINSNAKIKKLYSYLPPHEVIKIRRKMSRAINILDKWMFETVKQMQAAKGSQLLNIYIQRIAALEFPSLPTEIIVVKKTKTVHKVSRYISKYFPTKGGRRTFAQISKNLKPVNLRSEIESKITTQLRNAIPTIQLVSQYIGPFKNILARKQMFKFGPNRAFLNRFWNLAKRKFEAASGNEKLKYEFIAMIMDSIKDDNELVSLSVRIQPMLTEILRGTSGANKFAHRYFDKGFAELKPQEVKTLLTMLLPSQKTTPQMIQSEGYKAMKQELVALFKDPEIQKLKKTEYETYIAMTTVAQNLLNIAGSIAIEQDPVKIEQKIKFFKAGFAAIKKLLGTKGINFIRKSNARAAEFIENPNNEAVKLIASNRKSLVKYLKTSPEANKLAVRYLGKGMSQLTSKEVEAIIELLLPSQVIKPKDYDTQAYRDLKTTLNAMLEFGGFAAIEKKNYLAGLAIKTAIKNMLDIYASLVNEENPLKAKRKINKFINGIHAIQQLLGPDGIAKIKKQNANLAEMIQHPEKAVVFISDSSQPVVKKEIARFKKLNNLQYPRSVKTTLKAAQQARSELIKRRQGYLAKLVMTKNVKGIKKTFYNQIYAKLIKQLEEDIAKIGGIIDNLKLTWNEKDFKRKEANIKKVLFGTKFLKITPKLQRYFSLTAVRDKKKKIDFNSIFDISAFINVQLSAQLKKICKTRNCEFAYARLSKVLENIVLTVGKEEQLKSGKKSAYNYLFLLRHFKKYATEIGKRVDAVLRQARFTDTAEVKGRIVFFESKTAISKYVVALLNKYVRQKASKAAPKRTA